MVPPRYRATPAVDHGAAGTPAAPISAVVAAKAAVVSTSSLVDGSMRRDASWTLMPEGRGT